MFENPVSSIVEKISEILYLKIAQWDGRKLSIYCQSTFKRYTKLRWKDATKNKYVLYAIKKSFEPHYTP